MAITERILQLIENENITKYKFCKDLGVSKGFLDKSREITTDKYANILDYFPNASPEWLLTGEGEMLKSENKMSDSLIPSADGYPLIPIEAIAGRGKGEFTIQERDIEERYIVPSWRNKHIDYLIRVSGSSMYPKYSNGDIVACHRVTDKSFIQWNRPYVLDTDQGAMVKRLLPCEEDGECLMCKSDNPDYPLFKICKESIYSISVIVGVIRNE